MFIVVEPFNIGEWNVLDNQVWLLLIPLLLIQLGLMAFALLDLVKRRRVKGENKWIWGAAIVFINIIGPIIYLVLGREEE